ncbi:MAG: type II toxin-antitoxin system VapC family toxin [Burkholderiales bacterium]
MPEKTRILLVLKTSPGPGVYLIDTDVLSEVRKGHRAHAGVLAFFQRLSNEDILVYLSVVTLGELRRGVETIRHRGDSAQAEMLDKWLSNVLKHYADRILPLDEDIAQVWGRLRVPNHENALDKQIAATALVHNLVLATRNVQHFRGLGLELFNPFEQTGDP